MQRAKKIGIGGGILAAAVAAIAQSLDDPAMLARLLDDAPMLLIAVLWFGSELEDMRGKLDILGGRLERAIVRTSVRPPAFPREDEDTQP